MDYINGDDGALNNFLEANPEYETRNFLFKEPEERMRAHMINLIWERYMDLSTPQKQNITDALGEPFKAYFLDTETRNYDAVDTNTLATWTRVFGYEPPVTEYTEAGTKAILPPVKQYEPNVEAEIQQFIETRSEQFPNYYWLNSLYYKLPAGSKKQKKLEKDFPELNAYRDWLKEYKKQHPNVAAYLEERAAKAGGDLADYPKDYTGEQWQKTVANFDANLLVELMNYKMLIDYPEPGDPEPMLSEGALAELMALWEQLGRPGDDFDLWFKAFLGY
jgi:hypothetical protein